MTMSRPNAVIYQEYTSIDSATDTPDLYATVVGPCYQIEDFLDDRADCKEDTDYGTEDDPIPSAGAANYTPPVAVVYAAPKNRIAGAVLQAASVKLFLDEVRAVVTEHPAAPAGDGTYAINDNLFSADGSTAGGVNFGFVGVLPGDILFAESSVTANFKKTVKELCYTMIDAEAIVGTDDSGGTGATFLTDSTKSWAVNELVGQTINNTTDGSSAVITSNTPTTVLGTLSGGSGNVWDNLDAYTISSKFDLVNNGVGVDDIVTVSLDGSATSRNGTYTVKRVIDATHMEVAEAIPGSGVLSGTDTASVRIASPGGTTKVNKTKVLLFDWCNLRCTSDFSENSPASVKWRIERELDDVEMDSDDIEINGNQITIKAGRTTAITSTLTGAITYGEVYFEYMALRTDLATLTTISSSTQREQILGKLDARNPLAVGAYVTALNQPTMPLKVYGIDDVVNEATSYLNFIDNISTVTELYTVIPLTQNTTVLATLNSMAETMADPNEALDNGTRQKFRMILGNVRLVTEKYLQIATGGATTEQENNTESAALKTCTFSGAVGATAGLITNGVIPGDILSVNSGAALYTVAHVNSETELELDEVLVDYASAAVEVTEIYPVGVPGSPRVTLTGTGGAGDVTLAGTGLDELFTILYLPDATFITDGILPTDEVEMPGDPDTNVWTGTVVSWEVDEVLSEERLRVKNNGNDSSTTANELPHTGKREGSALVTQGSMFVRVKRDLDKDQQVTEMVAVATSFASKRMVLAYPDSVDVSGLKDGSLPRYGAVEPADAEPQMGYYLACAIGGMTASQPSQQGFTNMGIAGIDAIYNASEYFNEQQMTDLSNGGVYVFQQDSPDALPYTIHEVTTDTSGLQVGEYMAVKNLDFVSMTFLSTILGFLGIWNVTKQTMNFIGEALQGDIGVLKKRYVSKIGAPLIDASITSLAESELSSDRIEVYIDGDFPMVLNTIGLHLVA